MMAAKEPGGWVLLGEFPEPSGGIEHVEYNSSRIHKFKDGGVGALLRVQIKEKEGYYMAAANPGTQLYILRQIMAAGAAIQYTPNIFTGPICPGNIGAALLAVGARVP